MPELVEDLGSAGRTPKSPTSTVRPKPISTIVHIRARTMSDAATPIRTRRIVLIIIPPKQVSIPKRLRLRSLAARSDEAMACDPAENRLYHQWDFGLGFWHIASAWAWHLAHTHMTHSTRMAQEVHFTGECVDENLMTINCRNRNMTLPAASLAFTLFQFSARPAWPVTDAMSGA